MTQCDVIGFGAAHWDRLYTTLAPARLGTSNPVSLATSPGGVARNVMAGLARMGIPAGIVSILGTDPAGDELLARLVASGLDCSGMMRAPDAPTASYTAILDSSGELIIGAADMAIYDRFDAGEVLRVAGTAAEAGWWFADANLPFDCLGVLGRLFRRPPLAVDAVSTLKAPRLRTLLDCIDLLFCNVDEARVLLERDDGDAEALALALLERGVDAVVVSAGADGLAYGEEGQVARLAALPVPVIDVTGAGDALMAGALYALLDGAPLEAAASFGVASAGMALRTKGADGSFLFPGGSDDDGRNVTA